MSIEYEGDKMEEILRLTRENNRMLHSMRRSAWLGGIIKFILYAGLILVPLWFYAQYIAPVLQTMLDTYQHMQGTSAQAQAQLGQMSELLNHLKGFGGF